VTRREGDRPIERGERDPHLVFPTTPNNHNMQICNNDYLLAQRGFV
jgi:hypothetical protein